MRRTDKPLRLAASLYMGMMLVLLMVRQRDVGRLPYWQTTVEHFNPVPFTTIRLYLELLHRPQWRLLSLANLVGNVVMFIPMGWFLPIFFPQLRRFYRTVLASVGIMLCVEVLQMLFLVGTCDIDDLMLNTMGSAIGYGVYQFGKWVGRRVQ